MTVQELQERIAQRKRITVILMLVVVCFLVWALLAPSLGLAVLLAGVLAGTLVLFPWIAGDLEVCHLSPKLRECWPDKQFVTLSDGVTHYQLAGPEDGPKVVLVTGLASTFFIWDYVFKELAEAGFRVLRYDNFGRGLSDRPHLRYDAALFDRQLLELLDALHFTEPVDLVGLSMGGMTVARFMDLHPERVRRYVLMAPAGLPYRKKLAQRLLQAPGLGEWLMKAFGDHNILFMLPNEIGYGSEKVQQALAAYHGQMQFHGYKRALLSTFRHNPLDKALPIYERIGSQPKLGLLIWGTQDTVAPFSNHVRLQAAIPSIRFHPVEGGTHPVCYQRPEAVTPVLIEFLGR